MLITDLVIDLEYDKIVYHIIWLNYFLCDIEKNQTHEQPSTFTDEAFNVVVHFLSSHISCYSLGSKYWEKLSKHHSLTRVSVSTIS